MYSERSSRKEVRYRARDVLKKWKLEKQAEAEKIKREPRPEQPQNEQTREPEAASAVSSQSEVSAMPPPPRPQSRSERSVTDDGCTHENCAMVPSNAFWLCLRVHAHTAKELLTAEADCR